MDAKRCCTGLLATLIVVTACDEDAAGPQVAEDVMPVEHVALLAADATLADLDQFVLPGFGFARAGVSGPIAANETTFGGTREVTFYDVQGNEQDAYDPLETARIEIVADVTRERTRDRWSAVVTRHREMEVSGLAGDETTRTWNGTGSTDAVRSRHDDEGGDVTYDVDGATTVTDVVRAVDREAQPWPLSGSITHVLTIAVSGGPRDGTVIERTATVTFDGGQFATMVVDGETFEVDLASDERRRPFRGRRG